MNKFLSIIIVNYNGKHYLKDCLDSLKKCCGGINHEVIIFDNASTDNSIDFIQQNFPKIQLIESKENIGFARGNNKAVQSSKGDLILLLNNDTVLLDNILPAIEVVDRDKVGVVGIKMLGKQNEYRRSVGKFPTPIRLLKLSWLYYNSIDFKNGKFGKSQYEVDWIEGSFLLTKRKIWDSIGGLDSDYFMYVEDLDFCKKVRLADKKAIYFTECSYIHYGGYSKQRGELLKNGFKKYINKHHKGLTKKISVLSLEFNYFVKYAKEIIRKTTC